MEEQFEDTKGVIKSCKLKGIRYTGQNMDKANDHNTTHKTTEVQQHELF